MFTAAGAILTTKAQMAANAANLDNKIIPENNYNKKESSLRPYKRK